MRHDPVLVADPVSWLERAGTDQPVQFFCAAALRARHDLFRTHFPGMVTFAVKANPSPDVLESLAGGGMRAFDVASPAEIALVRRIAPQAALHYHNPVRSRDEIAFAKAAGVLSWSVDNAAELDKLIAAGVTGEVAVRFALPVAGAAYDFGAKFGADPAQAVGLLQQAAAAGLAASLTFHVGTQCTTPAPWLTYIATAARIALIAGIRLHRLNVGGGFPSARNGEAPDYKGFFMAIQEAAAAACPDVPLVCEPGRALVADAFAYAAKVKSIRQGPAIGRHVYLNDGIYGGLFEFASLGASAFRVIGGQGPKAGECAPAVVYGPTCDSLDRLPQPLDLPLSLQEGDWVLFQAMGAYLEGITTRFNGYGTWDRVAVAAL